MWCRSSSTRRTWLNITVKPENQGRGLGLTLLEHLMSIACKADARECFLEVRDSNTAAFKLYERYGFNEIGRRRDYYPAVGGREDAVVMACTLRTKASAIASRLAPKRFCVAP